MSISISVILDFNNEDKELKMVPISISDSACVSDIKKLYQKSTDMDIQFIYRGEIISDPVYLKDIGVGEGSCVKLFFTRSQPEFQVDNIENSISEIIRKHREIMKSRSKDMINKIILEEMDNIIEASPELESDLVAYSIAIDYRLLRTLFSSRENVSRILEKHPVLIPAALKTINIIQERVQKLSCPSKSSDEYNSRFFSLREVEQSDNSSTDDEDDQPSTSQQESITRSQLRQAIGSVTNVQSRNPTARISLDQLRSAVRTALHDQSEPMEVDEVQSGAMGGSNMPSGDAIESKLSQLQSMGFIDRNANKIALEATGGNIEAAIEYLLN